MVSFGSITAVWPSFIVISMASAQYSQSNFAHFRNAGFFLESSYLCRTFLPAFFRFERLFIISLQLNKIHRYRPLPFEVFGQCEKRGLVGQSECHQSGDWESAEQLWPAWPHRPASAYPVGRTVAAACHLSDNYGQKEFFDFWRADKRIRLPPYVLGDRMVEAIGTARLYSVCRHARLWISEPGV